MASNFKIYTDDKGNEITILPGRVMDAAGYLSRDTAGAFATLGFIEALEEQGFATLN